MCPFQTNFFKNKYNKKCSNQTVLNCQNTLNSYLTSAFTLHLQAEQNLKLLHFIPRQLIVHCGYTATVIHYYNSKEIPCIPEVLITLLLFSLEYFVFQTGDFEVLQRSIIYIIYIYIRMITNKNSIFQD